MADLRGSYLGLEPRNPVIVSAGSLSQSVENIKAPADAGLGTMIMFPLFEEQLLQGVERLVELEEQFADITPEAISFFPEMPRAEVGAVTNYPWPVEKGVQTIDVPLIVSLNGVPHGGWVRSARSLQDAGVAVLELSIYYAPGDLILGGEEVEQRHLDILRVVKSEVSVPVTVKLSPYSSLVGAMCQRLDRAGADGLVLLNRSLQPDIDLGRLEVVSGATLSLPVDARLSHTWIAVLRDHMEASLAVSSGADQPGDAVRHLLVRAGAVCTASALARYGAKHATRLVEGLESRSDGRRLILDQARGMLVVSGRTSADACERAGYVAALEKTKMTHGSLS